MRQILFIFFFALQINLFGSLSFENTVPNIPLASDNVGEFRVDIKVLSISDLLLGSSFTIHVPDSLPDISSSNIDDGKMYVSYDVYDEDNKKYFAYPGLRVNVYDRSIVFTISSRLYTLVSDDNFKTKRGFKNDDYIRITFSASKDRINIANSKYSDMTKMTASSSSIRIIDNFNSIKTPAKLISINNPAIKLSKNGLGAKGNLNFKWSIKGGIKKGTRIEIIFPKNFDISGLSNLAQNIYINQQSVNHKSIIDSQKLSFLVNKNIKSDKIEMNIFGDNIRNPLVKSDAPFTLNMYINNDKYVEQYSIYPTLDRVYYEDMDNNLAYSKGDRIIIVLFKEVLISSFTSKENITIENEINGSKFGTNYPFYATNRKGAYASKFAIVLGDEFKISKGLNVAIKSSSIITSENVAAIKDINFTIPSYMDKNINDSIVSTYNKLYATNIIDVLYNSLSSDTPSISTKGFAIKDVDDSATYSKGDTISVRFSKPVDSRQILNINSISLPFADTRLGDGFSISLLDDRVIRENFYSNYEITLGNNPQIKTNSQFAFKQSSIISKDGSMALHDVIFSNLPIIQRPEAKQKDIEFRDSDSNGVYSKGDYLHFSFTQNISPLGIKDFKALNNKKIDGEFITIKDSKNGYSSKFYIKIGAKTNLVKGDIIEISKDKVINEHGTSAGTSIEKIRFNVVDMTIPSIKSMTFNHTNMQLTMKFHTKIYESKEEHLSKDKSILITYKKVKKNLQDLGIKYTISNITNGSDTIVIDFEDTFMGTINTDSFSVIIIEDAFKTKNNIGNPRFQKTFNKPTKISHLIPKAWNLTAIQNNKTNTTIKNILNTNKVEKIWVFKDNKWVNDEDSIIKRGDGFWVVPKEGIKGIDNIETIISLDTKFDHNTSVLSVIKTFDSNTSTPFGNSAINCDDMKQKIYIKDIQALNTADRNITVFTFDSTNSKWTKNKDIFPCEGFLISITGKI